DYLAKGKVLCSMLKLVETAVFTSIEAKMEGTWSSGHIQLGIKEGGVGISPMTYTGEIKNGSYVFNDVNKSRWEHIQDIINDIIDGDIVVDDELIEETPIPGFEWMIILILFGLAAIQIRKRR
ncbi:MAG: hypothetical protein ACFFAE_13795, partial [Candidatus Hodarchaeota archaeon]